MARRGEILPRAAGGGAGEGGFCAARGGCEPTEVLQLHAKDIRVGWVVEEDGALEVLHGVAIEREDAGERHAKLLETAVDPPELLEGTIEVGARLRERDVGFGHIGPHKR